MQKFRDTPIGVVPCEGGDLVLLEDAARHFQWTAFNKVINWLNSREELMICRKELMRVLIDFRPYTADSSFCLNCTNREGGTEPPISGENDP